MIELYVEGSPAVFKAAIMLEECGLDYRCRHVSISHGMQHEPEFRALSPNGKIPVIVDAAPADGGEPLAVFESGAILVYLAEKTGRFLPTEPRARTQVMQWLFWQSSGLSPFSGQAVHFLRYAPEAARPYGRLRYIGEMKRHWAVLDTHLAGREWIAGDYSIADIGAFPWINMADRFRMTFDDLPELDRWWRAVGERPAVRRAYDKVVAARVDRPIDEEAFRRNLFGAAAEQMPGTGPRG
ncbi:glutathione S-transferase family protein [Novosphingobium bradum]|uniref:Glutathione S-transferase family protein n=1 Tax=Novosphingobium bradum TaxID=1737444 RepID=A0ABV7INY0_9SPHN